MNVARKEQELFDRWRISCPDLVPDGVVDEGAYLSSSPKIILIMKEVNSPGDSDWDLREFIRKGARRQTWDNVTRWVIGIRHLPEDIPWRDLKEISNEQRQDHLKTLSVMNLKKSPGSHTTDNNELAAAALRDRDLLNEQFSLYDPDLIVCCGSITCDRFQESVRLQYSSDWATTKRGVWFRIFNSDRILVSYSHPEARVDHPLLYYGLVDGIREITGETRMKMTDVETKIIGNSAI